MAVGLVMSELLPILAGAVVAWLLLLVAMSDRKIMRPQVVVTLTANAEAFARALGEAARRLTPTMAEVSRSMAKVAEATRLSTPSVKRLAAALEQAFSEEGDRG